MPFTFYNPPALTPEQMNPFAGALSQGLKTYGQGIQSAFMLPMAQQELQKNYLENMINQVKAKYAEPMTQQELKKAELYNQYYAPDILSQIGLRGANAHHLGAETNKINYQLSHPGYMAGGQGALLQYLNDAGYMNQQQPNAAPQAAQIPQQPVQTQPQEFGAVNQASPALVNDIANNGNNAYRGLPPAQSQTPPVGVAPNQLGQITGGQIFNTGNPMADAILNRPFKEIELQQKRLNAMAWTSSPPVAKNYMIAQAAGMGIDPSTATHAFAEGKTIDQLAVEHGFDPQNKPEPDYLPTQSNVTKLNQRKAALAELKPLSEFITSSLGPYAKTIPFTNLSGAQIKDALTGKNKDQQARFLAAMGLAPEQTNLRLMTANARSSVHAQKELMNKSMLNIGALRSLVDPEVWTKAQQIMDEQLSKAMGQSIAAFTVGKNKPTKETKSETKENKEEKGKQTAAPEGTIWMKDKNGNRMAVHRSRIEEAKRLYQLEET